MPRLRAVSRLSKFKAMRLSMERFCAAFPARLRRTSSRKTASSRAAPRMQQF